MWEIRLTDIINQVCRMYKSYKEGRRYSYVCKIDLDEKSRGLLIETSRRFNTIIKFFGILEYKIDEKESRHGYHVRIDFVSNRKLTDMDIVVMQLLLGSDWRREMFNYLRVKSKCRRWNVLFKEKFKVENGEVKILSKEKELP